MKKIIITQLGEILRFYQGLEKVYETLADLESKQKMDSSAYAENIEYVKMFLDIVKEKFKKIHFDDASLIEAEATIASLNQLDNENQDFVIDVLELKKNLAARRLCMVLYMIARENNIGYLEEDIVASPYPEYKAIADEMILEEFEKEDELDLIKDHLFANTLMDYLLEAIQNEKDEEVRDELIHIKYRLIFMLPTLEPRFVNEPYHFTKTALYQSLLQLKVEDNPELYQEEYSYTLQNTIEYELIYLSKLPPTYYRTKKNKICLLLRIIYLKASMSINYSPSVDYYLKETLEELISSAKNQKTKESLTEAFAVKKELTMPKIVDFNDYT